LKKIIWLTGHSGAGKTTLAKRLQENWPCIILDGDEMRDSISFCAGFSRDERAEHNYRVARLAKVLSKQSNVVVAVIAPMRDVRAIIDGICFPQWVYVKRTLPEREGHFYEEPDNDYPVIDHDKLNRKESCVTLMKILGIEKKIYSVFIGRWQPLHAGHLALFDKVRSEGKNIAIGIRDTEISENNPYNIAQRKRRIKAQVPDAKIFVIPDTEEIVYGRKVGWGIREIRFDKDIEAISATEIRCA
jgi:energy-coupling factor transporter ATP-binding protein EcfA2